MTTHNSFILENGDEVQVMTNPGATPIVYLNGVMQNAGDYRFVNGRPFFGDDIVKWQSWYAWHPVRVKGKWYWLTQVYRRRKGALFKRYDSWIYGDDFDALKGIK